MGRIQQGLNLTQEPLPRCRILRSFLLVCSLFIIPLLNAQENEYTWLLEGGINRALLVGTNFSQQRLGNAYGTGFQVAGTVRWNFRGPLFWRIPRF